MSMRPRFVFREQLTHSTNPYIHKCCGCLHLRAGATFICLIWAGLSLYFSILSFQEKSPFYSYIEPTALYLFGTINLILFGVSLGTLFPIYLKSAHGIRAASVIFNMVIPILLISTFANTILFIVQKSIYVRWCINSKSANLDSILFQQQNITTTTENFNSNMNDFYNCNRTWEGEVKFSSLSTIVMIAVYGYFAISVYSYKVKLRMRIERSLREKMDSRMPF
ncbi:hypothetical protein BD770DRAFT_397445 [Pilaira anomala]|nr:hypothetical protein BD770DRAFT_397445 [Pilaira anomala]